MARKANDQLMETSEQLNEQEVLQGISAETLPEIKELSVVLEETLSSTLQTEEPPLEETAQSEQAVEPEPSPDLQTKPAKARTSRTKSAKAEKTDPTEDKPQSARQAFYSLDFRALDRDLSPEQEQEWNAIYASFRSRSILTGTVVGVDEHTFDITDENGETSRRTVQSLVMIGYRVKVMIPDTEVWAAGEENSRYATRSMVGSKIDYVVMNVDRENDCAIASRRMAMTKKRRYF